MTETAGNLRTRALLGSAKFLILMGLLLFVPAGTTGFWQAWVFWLVFSTSALLITLYFLKRDPELVERRLKAGPAAEKETSQKIIQVLASACSLLIIAVAGLDHRFGWSNVPKWLVIVSNVFVAAGFLITFLVFRENSFTSAVIEVSPDQRVISTGPYRFVRHPLYAGALLMFLFAPMALGSYRALLVVPLLVAVLVWRLLEEERFLERNLPGYRAYRRKTRYRLVPAVW
jgi:protein-S-isoprenylcysteine O-methyltransferase Ste14